MASLGWHVLCAQEPVPQGASLQAAEAEVAEQYKTELSKAVTAAAKVDLAVQLRTLVKNSPKMESAKRFALLRKARDLAAAAGDAAVALAAVDDLAAEFQAPRLAWRAEALAEAAQAVTAPKAKSVADVALASVTEALVAEDDASAKRFAEAALVAARKARDPALLKAANEVVAGFSQAEKQEEAAAAALQTLATTPDDPAANLTLGRHLCFGRGDWAQGLSYLSRGSDPELQRLAKLELTSPVDAGAQAALAEAWWELGEKSVPAMRAKLRNRALHWYRLAAPALEGPAKAKADRRIADAAARPEVAIKKAPAAEDTPLDPAIQRGLDYLVKQQQPEGHWQGSNPGDKANEMETSAFALIAMVRCGQTPKKGRHITPVSQGLNYLLAQSGTTGNLGGTNSCINGLAAHALCETAVHIDDPAFRKRVQLVVDHIVRSQLREGGWQRYTDKGGEIFATVWSIRALRLANDAKLTVPAVNVAAARRFVESLQAADRLSCRCTQTGNPTDICTAVAMQTLVEMGEPADSPRIAPGLARLHSLQVTPQSFELDFNITLLTQKVGGATWDSWKAKVRKRVLEADSNLNGDWGSIAKSCFALMTLQATQ